ncbi:MAG: ROK family protein [Acidobacteriota bacterium]
MNLKLEYVIGMDVGGTRLKSGAVSRGGRLLASGISPTGARQGPKALLESLKSEVERISARLGYAPVAVGLGFPGAVDPANGVVLLPGRLKGLEGYAIVPKLAKALRIPVVAENDGRISILAEKHYGLARDKKWVVTITLGTGVGSGVMLDGQILRDPHLQFGTQMSHIVIQVGGRLCLTGARGTGEMLCSATALAMAVRDGLQRGIASLLTDRYFDDPKSVDFEAVMEGVRKKDRLCLDELKYWTRNLGWLLVSAIHVYAPELIILSGGAIHGARHFLRPLREQVNQHIFRYPVGEPVPIVVSKMGDLAGVLGAAAVAWNHASRIPVAARRHS